MHESCPFFIFLRNNRDATPVKEVDCSVFCNAFDDTGASVSVVSRELGRRTRLSTGVMKIMIQAKFPNGNMMNFEVGICDLFVIGDTRS